MIQKSKNSFGEEILFWTDRIKHNIISLMGHLNLVLDKSIVQLFSKIKCGSSEVKIHQV